MANKLLTKKDITREFLRIFHESSVLMPIATKKFENKLVPSDAKNGGSIDIRKPVKVGVKDGNVFSAQDAGDSIVTLTANQRKHVGLNFTDTELTLSIDDFSARYLKPAASRMAREIDLYIGNLILANNGGRVTRASLTAAPTFQDTVTKLNARLSGQLADKDMRRLAADSDVHADIVNSSAGFFNAQRQLEKQYEDGVMYNAGGFDWVESQSLPVITVDGTFTGGTTAANINQGATSVSVTGGAGTAKKIVKGQAFTVGGIYECDPETLTKLPRLKVFIAADNATITAGAVTIPVAEKIVAGVFSSGLVTAPTGYVLSEVNCYSATATATVVKVDGVTDADDNVTVLESATTGLSGSLIAAIAKDSIAFGSVALELDETMHGARETMDGVSMRLAKFYDGTNSAVNYRMDVLFGASIIRPEWIQTAIGKLQ